MAEHQNDWPHRRVTILAPNTALVIISTLFAMWRVIYGIKTKRKGIICDVLLSVAVILNIASIIIHFKSQPTMGT
ncbi:hypothetical protein yc1106_02423 [Curvularia clavata]|uniref:Uncharacterized protein n=1 Tax=Curvularia clavata TaxID=95742 RepID=A0A9Q8Z373_CURCL|nr:hypothetical protein yc1106_02423 [Curvularia clavata]